MSRQYWEVGGGGCGDPSFELCGHQFLPPEPQGPFHGSYICIRVAKCFTTKSRNLKAVFCALCMQFLLPGENRCLHRCEAGQRTMARARPILCWPLHRNSYGLVDIGRIFAPLPSGRPPHPPRKRLSRQFPRCPLMFSFQRIQSISGQYKPVLRRLQCCV